MNTDCLIAKECPQCEYSLAVLTFKTKEAWERRDSTQCEYRCKKCDWAEDYKIDDMPPQFRFVDTKSQKPIPLLVNQKGLFYE